MAFSSQLDSDLTLRGWCGWSLLRGCQSQPRPCPRHGHGSEAITEGGKGIPVAELGLGCTRALGALDSCGVGTEYSPGGGKGVRCHQHWTWAHGGTES